MKVKFQSRLSDYGIEVCQLFDDRYGIKYDSRHAIGQSVIGNIDFMSIIVFDDMSGVKKQTHFHAVISLAKQRQTRLGRRLSTDVNTA